MNIVKKIHDICNQEGIEFRYSTEAGLNLLDNTEDGVIYFCLLSPLKREKVFGNFGGVIKNVWTATAFLLTQSRLENTIYNENEYSQAGSKYDKNIAPLYDVSDVLQKKISGCGVNITQWTDNDTYDELDSNLDGLIIQFKYEENN